MLVWKGLQQDQAHLPTARNANFALPKATGQTAFEK
jgi:hypothetical protein